MSKKAEREKMDAMKVDTREQSTELVPVRSLATLAEVMPRAPIVAPATIEDRYNIDLGSGWEEAESPFCPMVDFSEDSMVDPPCFFFGLFDTVRSIEMVGRPNGVQQIYEFLVPGKDGAPERVGIWASTILTDRMARLNPSKGAQVVVIFQGLGEATPGKNPPKIFRVFKREPEPAIGPMKGSSER